MICPICRDEIKLQKLNSHFKITLGNLINGRFYSDKTFYYHKDCLSEKNLNERERIIA